MSCYNRYGEITRLPAKIVHDPICHNRTWSNRGKKVSTNNPKMYRKFITINYIVCVRLYLPLRSLVANSVSCHRAIYPNFMWFLFIYIYSCNYRVIAWRHLLHRSKLSAINDSFSHIAFSISITYERILYITYNIYGACIKTLNKVWGEAHDICYESVNFICGSVNVLIHTNRRNLLSQRRPFVVPRCSFQFYQSNGVPVSGRCRRFAVWMIHRIWFLQTFQSFLLFNFQTYTHLLHTNGARWPNDTIIHTLCQLLLCAIEIRFGV